MRKNPAEPEGNNGYDSVPISATDLPNSYYKGNLTCKSCIMGDDFYADPAYDTSKQKVEQSYKDYFTTDSFYLKIANNKLKWEENESLIEKAEEKGALKSSSEYGATIEYGENNEQGSTKERKTIKFTISGDTISITYIEGASVDGQVVDGEDEDGNKTYVYVKYSYYATYEGTLTKYEYNPTPTPSGS